MESDSRDAVETPAVTVVEITDPTAVDAGIELIDMDAIQLEPMLPLRAQRVVVRLDAATVVFHSTNRRLRTYTRVLQGLLGYVTFGPQANGTVNGLPVRPGLMLAGEPETEARFVVDAGWESVAFLVSPNDLRAHFDARRYGHELHMPRGLEPLRADPDGCLRLFDWGKRLTTTAAGQPAIFSEGRKERVAAEVELFDTLLPVLDTADKVEPTRGERTRQAHSAIVKTAEDHAIARIGEPLSVTDLCRATGVSQRTLEYAFQHVMGLTPVAYLIRLRLHRARQGLLAGTHGSTTVATEAVNWGFWHLGEFSRTYKDCFGELPSETLRRSSHDSR